MKYLVAMTACLLLACAFVMYVRYRPPLHHANVSPYGRQWLVECAPDRGVIAFAQPSQADADHDCAIILKVDSELRMKMRP